MVIFICGEEPEDIWCAVYDAWMSRLGHKNVRIEPRGCDADLFCEYREAVTSEEKAAKVTDSIRWKLGECLYEEVYKAALSEERFRADCIYRFLIDAFAWGPKVMDRLDLPEVYEIFRMNRHLMREYDHLRGFVRFAEWNNRLLAAHIRPKNDVTALLARHFADRMSGENWLIYDEGRKKGAFHRAGHGWVILRFSWEELEQNEAYAADELTYETLWRTFHTSIAIRERRNPRCQMNMLPLRFRPYMTEFTENE